MANNRSGIPRGRTILCKMVFPPASEFTTVRNIIAAFLFSITSFAFSAGAGEYALNEQELQRYTGDFWEADEAFAAEVRVIDGKLWAVHSPTRRNELVPAGPDRFEMTGLPAKVFVEYRLDASGIVEMRRTIDGKERGRFMPFTPREPTSDELAEYAGDYVAPEGASRFLLAVEDGKLLFRSADGGKQELNALFGETFEHPDTGSFIFNRGADGQISGFLLRSRQAPGQVFEKR